MRKQVKDRAVDCDSLPALAPALLPAGEVEVKPRNELAARRPT